MKRFARLELKLPYKKLCITYQLFPLVSTTLCVRTNDVGSIIPVCRPMVKWACSCPCGCRALPGMQSAHYFWQQPTTLNQRIKNTHTHPSKHRKHSTQHFSTSVWVTVAKENSIIGELLQQFHTFQYKWSRRQDSSVSNHSNSSNLVYAIIQTECQDIAWSDQAKTTLKRKILLVTHQKSLNCWFLWMQPFTPFQDVLLASYKIPTAMVQMQGNLYNTIVTFAQWNFTPKLQKQKNQDYSS